MRLISRREPDILMWHEPLCLIGGSRSEQKLGLGVHPNPTNNITPIRSRDEVNSPSLYCDMRDAEVGDINPWEGLVWNRIYPSPYDAITAGRKRRSERVPRDHNILVCGSS